MRLNSRFLLYGIFALVVVILGMWLVMAAMSAPTPAFQQNTTRNYDKEGIFTVNWTNVSDGVANNATHNIYVNYSNGTIFQTRIAIANYSFSSTVNANYTFIVEAVNGSAPTDRANSSTLWMVVDTVIPSLSYNSNTETSDASVNRNYIFVNVSASDINNVSSNLTFFLYNGTSGTLVRSNVTNYTTNTFNWTGLAEGKYIFNVTANDSATNSNSTSSRTFYLDRTNPTATATCTANIYEGESFPCTCSGTDSLTSVTTSQSSTSGSITDTTVIGLYTYTCSATDSAGNSASATKQYTVLNIGGGAATPKLPQNIHSWSKITPGVVGIMKDFDPEIGVKQIQIEVNNEAQNVQITVTKYDGKPAEVSVSKSGKVYQYLQIDAQNLGIKLDKATVQFRVEKSWASSNSLDKDEVSVYKFDESSSKWNKLTTTYASEDSTYYYYDAEFDSFSYFAIAEGATTVPETGAGTSEEGRNLTWLWILIALVIGTVVWRMMRKK